MARLEERPRTRPAGRRELQKDERRRRLLEAALELFEEHGYEAVGVQDIAHAAGLAKGTFFNYFESKAHVLIEYAAGVMGELLAYARRLRGDGARELFQRFFGHMADLYRREGVRIDLMVARMPFEPEFQEAYGPLEREGRAMYRSFVQRGIDSGELAEDLDPELVADLLRDVWLSSLRTWVRSGHDHSLKARVRRKVDLVFDGLVAP
jgi:AcrR family transcriptional regulator